MSDMILKYFGININQNAVAHCVQDSKVKVRKVLGKNELGF